MLPDRHGAAAVERAVLDAAVTSFAETWLELLLSLPGDYECHMTCAEADAAAALFRALGRVDDAAAILAEHGEHDEEGDAHWQAAREPALLYRHVIGGAHEHVSPDGSGRVGHAHAGGGVPHAHDADVGFQIPLGCDPVNCEYKLPGGDHAPACKT